MHILLINHQAKPELSGVARHFENISESLVKLRHTIVRLVANDDNLSIKKNKAVTFVGFDYIKKSKSHTSLENKSRIEKNYQLFEESIKKLDWKNIDSVITSNDIYLTILKRYITPGKIIAIIPSSLTFSKSTNPQGYQAVVRRIKKNSKGANLVVLSSKMRSMLAELIGKEYAISVITPGVKLEAFPPTKQQGKENVILYLGRVAKEKNIEALISAMPHIKSNCTLKIVGAGDALPQLKNLAKTVSANKKEIIFTGRKKRVSKFYSQAKVFILPSKYEAFGLVILEAMASGLPVIAFKPSKNILTASDEIISNGVDGFLVKDSIELAEKVDLLLKDTPLRNKMGRNARKKACGFSWTEHAKKLLELPQA